MARVTRFNPSSNTIDELIGPGLKFSPGVGVGSIVSSGAATYTWSHTVLNTLHRILIVVVGCYSNATPSVTYGGVAMTAIGTAVNSGNNLRASAFYLLNPAVGTANVVVSGVSTSGACVSVDLYGVNQSSPIGTPQTSNGSGTSVSLTCTAGSGGLVIDCLSKNNANQPSYSAGQTQLGFTAFNTSYSESSSQSRNGTVTQTWSGSAQNAYMAFPINAG